MWNKLIIVLVIVLGAVAIAQLLRVNELTQKRTNHKEEDIPYSEHKFNGRMMLSFGIFLFLGTIWLMVKYGYCNLGPSASTNGETLDLLMDVNLWIVMIVFFGCNGVLFYFGWKYAKKPGSKAYWYPHNGKLEVLWTTVPSAVLTVLIIIGLKTWNTITSKAGPEYVNIELFAQQFSWTARYSGPNNKLGRFNYKLTTDSNPYAIMTKKNIDHSVDLMKNGEPGNPGVKMLEMKLNDPSVILSNKDRSDMEDELNSKTSMLQSLETMQATYKDSLDNLANDDVILEDTLVLLKGQKYNFHLRSKDVIHSAYFPQFRQQMNTVPGMTTYLKFQPIYTTKEMQKIMNDPKYQFALLCNKVCGASHYKMKMSIRVLGPKAFLDWQKAHKTLDGSNWIRGNEKKILKFYTSIANSVNKDK